MEEHRRPSPGQDAYISPGLVALGPGMFSVNGVTTIKLILEPS